ncbi:MAG: hypothetical protein K0S54_640 [Alphaproteobacteria bacterium]|nr:hypothetical protein [Alphaproteobacteria bacterium]
MVLLALALLAGPATYAHAQTQQAANLPSPDLPLPVLQSLDYVDIEKGRALSLIDGRYSDERRVLRLLATPMAQGDLDGDGTRDAVVLLEERNADTTILHLSAVVQRAGRVRNMASIKLGDHAQVTAMAIENGMIVLTLLTTGESDAAAEPRQRLLLGWKLAGSELLLMRREPKGRLTELPPAAGARH